MMDNNDPRDRRRRREVWIAMLGALFLGGFLLFGGFQAQIFPGLNAVAQGSLFPVAATPAQPTATPQPTDPAVIVPVVPIVPTPTAVQPTPTAVQPTPTARVLEGPLLVPFANRNGVSTTQSYTGPTTIKVSGSGQAQGKQFSDAFYLYTDGNGKPITPVHPKVNGLLCVNSKPIDSYVQTIPSYNPEHNYTITLNAPGGPLKFGVCDVPGQFNDNTNAFTITFV